MTYSSLFPLERRTFTTVNMSLSCAATMYCWHEIFLLFSSLWAHGIRYSSAVLCRYSVLLTWPFPLVFVRLIRHKVFTTVSMSPSCTARVYYWHDIFLLVSSLWAQGIHYSSAYRSLAFMTCSSLVPSWAKDLHYSSGCVRLLPLDCIACGLISACLLWTDIQ